MQFYEILKNYRDEFRKSNSYQAYLRIQPVLLQLMNIAFSNENIPDTLPNYFNITDVMLNKSELKYVMKSINLDAIISPIYNDFIKGNSFVVTLQNVSN